MRTSLGCAARFAIAWFASYTGAACSMDPPRATKSPRCCRSSPPPPCKAGAPSVQKSPAASIVSASPPKQSPAPPLTEALLCVPRSTVSPCTPACASRLANTAPRAPVQVCRQARARHRAPLPLTPRQRAAAPTPPLAGRHDPSGLRTARLHRTTRSADPASQGPSTHLPRRSRPRRSAPQSRGPRQFLASAPRGRLRGRGLRRQVLVAGADETGLRHGPSALPSLSQPPADRRAHHPAGRHPPHPRAPGASCRPAVPRTRSLASSARDPLLIRPRPRSRPRFDRFRRVAGRTTSALRGLPSSAGQPRLANQQPSHALVPSHGTSASPRTVPAPRPPIRRLRIRPLGAPILPNARASHGIMAPVSS